MVKFGWCAVWGVFLAQLSLAQIDLNVTCRFSGVFHVEKNGRYSISRTEAADLCKAFNCTLPTWDQMEEARKAGFETCRYGFIEGLAVIPRINPNPICAANNTGVYVVPSSNTSKYDAYCFNASAPIGKDCTSVTGLPNAFEGDININIVNPDGTHYTQQGEYRTNPDDILSSNSTDHGDTTSSKTPEDEFSGGEKSTLRSYTIFHTHLPTEHPAPDQDQTKYPEDTFATTGWEPTEENEDERDKHPSHSGSGIDDDEDFISSTISTTPRVFDTSKQIEDWNQWRPGFFNPEVTLQTTTRMTDVDRSGTSDYGENWTQEPQSSLIHHEHHDKEETQHSTSTTLATPSDVTEETATQKEQWVTNRWHGEYLQMLKEDSYATAGADASAYDSHPNQGLITQSQEDSSWTDFLDPISHPMGRDHHTERGMDMDSSRSTTLQPPADPNTSLVEDLDRKEFLSVTTQQSHTQSFSTSHEGLEEDKDQLMTSTPTSSTRNDDRGGNLPEHSTTSVGVYLPHSPDTKESTTLLPVTPAGSGASAVTEVTAVGVSNVHVDRSLSEDEDSSMDPSGRHHTTGGSESAGHSGGSPRDGATTTSGPKRKPQIPEWLIILASLLALALILAVCVAVNSRRRCGQKKKLVINNGKGAVEDGKPTGLNGEASKSQEMVHLVNKESSETPDQFTAADETQTLQNENVKIEV